MYKLTILGGDDRNRTYQFDKWRQVLAKIKVVQEVVGVKSASIELSATSQLDLTPKEVKK